MACDFGYIRELANSTELNPTDRDIEMTTTGVSSFMSSIRTTFEDLVTNVIKGYFKLTKAITSVITHLASSVISLLGSVATLVLCNTSGFLKAIHVTSIITNFTSMVMGITEIAGKFNVSWCPEAAASTAHIVVSDLIDNKEILDIKPNTVHANAFDPVSWVKAGVCAVVAVLFSGLGLSKLMPWRDIVTASNVVEGIKKTSTTVNGVADFLISEVAGFENSPDYPACKALEMLAEEGAQLQRYSPAHYVQHSEDLYKLKQFLPKLVKASSAPLSDKASKRFMTVKNLLVQIYKNLEEKERSIDAILSTKPRQATVGLLLSGAAGHGKSEFGKYILKKVAERMNYPKTIYKLNKRKDGFYDPYGGDALGEYNEWMATRSEDPLIPDLNTIFSSDPMNFEAAALDGKVQPCRLKIAFLTSNIDNPELIRVMNEGAAMAVWDRLYHIRVDDPKCQGRHFPNPHRKPDFSHLNFEHLQHNSIASFSTKKTDIATITSRLVGRCCEAEMHHIKSLLADPEKLSEEIIGALGARMLELKAIRSTNQPYEPREGYELGFDVYTDLFAHANAGLKGGREFYTIRFQGCFGSGKSRAAKHLALELANAFSYDIQASEEQEEFQPDPDKPMVYVLDDWIESSDLNLYVTQVNRTHPRSIIIICSNTVFVRKREYKIKYLAENAYNYFVGNKNLKPWDCTWFKRHPGFLRRAGLQGYVRMNPDQNSSDDLIQINESLNRTYTLDAHMVIRDAYGNIVNYDEITNTHFDLYRSYLTRPMDFTIIRGPPPLEDSGSIGARIEAAGTREIMECLRSRPQKMAAYNGTHPFVSMYLSPSITGANSASQTSVFDWAMSEEVTDDPSVFESVFSRFCGKFNRAFPGKSLTIKLKRENITMFYVNSTAYIYTKDEENIDICFSHTSDAIHYKRNSEETIIVTIEEYLVASLKHQYTGGMLKLTLSEIRRLTRYISTMLDSGVDSAFVTYYKLKQHQFSHIPNPIMLKIEAELRNHPFFWAGVGLLTVGVVAGGLYYLVKKLFFSNDLERKEPPEIKYTEYVNPPKANSDSPREAKGYTHSQQALRKLALKVNSDSPSEAKGKQASSKVLSKIRTIRSNAQQELPELDIKQEIAKYYSCKPMGQSEKALSNFLAEVEDGAHPIAALCNALTLTGTTDVKESPTLSTVHANMLRAADMIPQKESKLQELQKSLSRYAVRVVKPNGATCYGFALKGNYILTISHLFSDLGEDCQVISDSKYYCAKSVVINRARDLAVLYINDRKFPALADTRRFFHTIDEISESVYGFFLRLGPDSHIMGGGITYYPTTVMPITDRDTPNFKLSEQLVVFCAAGLYKVRDFVKSGDCGFPLVTLNSSNEYRMTGIHCAYNDSEKVYFSSFTREDHVKFLQEAQNYVTANAGVDMGVDTLIYDGEMEFLLPKVYTHALASTEEDTRYTEYHDKLDILGFNRTFCLRSNPKLGHVYVEVDGMQTDLLTLPAAFNEDFTQDPSALARDSTGRPDSLFTQCLKYDNTQQCSFNLETLNSAIELVRQDCVNRYGGCHWLRLHNVINGIPGRNLTPVDTSTSAGPLLKITHSINIKAPLFKLGDTDPNKRTLVFNDTEPAQMVRHHYETFVNSLHDGGPPPLMVSKDCAKVELIDADKARVGKVRLFNEVDLSINLMLKHFFGDFADKIMAQHESSPIRMGQDPYRCATHIFKQFEQIEGRIISTDFSAFDKQLPAVLIAAFCDIVASCYEREAYPSTDIYQIYWKLSLMLTHVLHTCRGTLYVVDRGNESGSFVTTIMNSVSVQILTYYTVVKQWYIIFKFTPSLSEVLSQTRIAILGDDRTFKCTPILDIREEDFVSDSREFCLKCTPAKTTGYIDFCSRSFTWDKFNQIVFPALKESSVVSQLRWYKGLTISQIITNLDNVLFEAALHADPRVFDRCLHDVRLLCEHFRLPPGSLAFYDRHIIRERFVLYIRDDDSFACLSQQVERQLEFSSASTVVEKYHRAFTERLEKKSATVSTADLPQHKLENRIKRAFSDKDSLMTDPALNPISALIERLRLVDTTSVPEDDVKEYDGGFLHVVKLFGYTASGLGPNKKAAKRAAYTEMYSKITSELEVRRANARQEKPLTNTQIESLGKDFMFRCIKIHLKFAAKLATSIEEPVIVLSATALQGNYEFRDNVRFFRDESGNACVLSETSQALSYRKLSPLYLQHHGTREDGDKIFIDPFGATSNASAPTSSGTVPPADAANNPGISSIPSMPNPVPLSMAPAMHENPGATLGAYEVLADAETYNTSGPPNMLSAGAIAFDLKDLVYNQFMDCDVMYTFADDTKDGSIIFQIPYSPTSKFVNPYIQQYVSLHERYAGDLMFRLTLVGNQTFSGLVGVCWQPKAVAGDTIRISEAQKYSYSATTVNEMWNKGLTLKDARQDLFWRSVSAENPKEEALRPHLVFFVLMPAQSPLREGISVRLRVASKLATNFQVSNPMLSAVPPTGPDSRAYGLSQVNVTRLIGSPVIPTLARPISRDTVKQFYLVMDGNTWLSEPESSYTSDYMFTDWPLSNSKWGYTYQAAEGQEYISDLRFYIRGDHDYVWLDLSRAPGFLNEYKTSKISGGEVVSDGHNGIAISMAFNEDLRTRSGLQVLQNPANYFKDRLTSTKYTELEGIARAQYAIELFVADPPKSLPLNGGESLNIDTFRLFYVMTSHGPVQYGYFHDTEQLPKSGSVLYDIGDTFNKITQVQTITSFDVDESMPTGWRHIAMSADIPFVYNEASRRSSVINHPSVISLVRYLNLNIGTTQCLQFSLGDIESGRDIAYVRYFPDRQTFAINTDDDTRYYGTSARPVDRMYITSIGIVERTNDFPITPVSSTFLDNQIHPESVRAYKDFH